MLTRRLVSLLVLYVLAISALPGPAIHRDDVNQRPLVSDQPEVLTGNQHAAHLRPEEGTIYHFLIHNPHFSRLAKLVNDSEDVVALLNDASARLTFFAVPDWALKHHHKHSPSKTDKKLSDDQFSDMVDLSDIASLVEDLETLSAPDKDKRRKFLKRRLTAILSYHVLPRALDAHQFARNITYATNLTLHDGSLDGQPLRLRVENTGLPPTLYINFITKVLRRDVKTKNGIIHVINHPLFPPPSMFQDVFFVPQSFSFLTSSIQRVGLTEAVEFQHVPDKHGKKGAMEGTKAATLFAPTNGAFMRLPKRLRLFLFSPFGERVLKKLLQFHVIPGLVLNSDYFHNATSNTHKDTSDLFHVVGVPQQPEKYPLSSKELFRLFDRRFTDSDDKTSAPPQRCRLKPPYLPPSPIYSVNLTLPTLLANRSLDIWIAKYKFTLPIPGRRQSVRYVTRFSVNGQSVGPFDIVARNGAVHVITKLLNPRPYPPHQRHADEVFREDQENWEKDWLDWEDWLFDWASED